MALSQLNDSFGEYFGIDSYSVVQASTSMLEGILELFTYRPPQATYLPLVKGNRG